MFVLTTTFAGNNDIKKWFQDYDATELNAISDVFYNGKSPTLVGSVCGNVGLTECPSGFVSLAKSIIAMETGVIPPTVGYNTPNPDVPTLTTGQLKVSYLLVNTDLTLSHPIIWPLRSLML